IKQAAWVPVGLGLAFLSGHLSVQERVGVNAAGMTAAVAIGLLLSRPLLVGVDVRVARAAISFSWPLAASQGASFALRFVDRFLLSALRGLDVAGVYALAAMAAGTCYSLSAVAVSTALITEAALANSKGDRQLRDRRVWQIAKYGGWLFLAISVLAFLSLG